MGFELPSAPATVAVPTPLTGVRRELIGLRELSERTDVRYRTLLRAAHPGRLEAVPVGRRWKVGRDAPERYMDTPHSRRLPKFRRRELIDDPWGSFPEPIGADTGGPDIPF